MHMIMAEKPCFVMSQWRDGRHLTVNLMVVVGGGGSKSSLGETEAQKWLQPRVCAGSAALHAHQCKLHTLHSTQSSSQINQDYRLAQWTEITPVHRWIVSHNTFSWSVFGSVVYSAVMESVVWLHQASYRTPIIWPQSSHCNTLPHFLMCQSCLS